MRFDARLAAAVALVCCGLTFGADAQPVASEQSGGGEQRQDAQEPQPQARNPGPADQAPAPAHERQGEHRDRAKNNPNDGGGEAGLFAPAKGWWIGFVGFVETNDTFLVALGTLVTAAFTAVLGGATIGLFVATRNLVKGAESTAERQLRAYVGTSRVYFRSFTPDAPISAVAEIKNFGATPARDYQTNLWLQVCPHPAPGPFAKAEIAFIEGAESLMPSNDSVVVCELALGPAAEVVITAIRQEKLALYLLGTIVYRDVFGNRRHTNVRKLARGDRINTNSPFINADEGNDST